MGRRSVVAVLGLVVVSACGGSNGGTPTTPTQATRIIAITGDLAFGDLLVGTSAERAMTIRNSGTGPLTVTSVNGPCSGAFVASWTSGQIPAGGSQTVTLRFAPTTAQSCSGTLTVNADHTSGSNTIPITARGIAPLFTMSGTGNTVFDMPTSVSRVRIIGSFGGSCQNFVVWIGGRLIVNEILGTCSVNTAGSRYEGVHLVTGGVVEVRSANGISWSFEEVR